MPALQFAKLHRHLVGKVPRQADDRTERAMQRALRAGWSEKKIKVYVDGIIAGKPEEPSTGEAVGVTPFSAPRHGYRKTERELVVRYDRVAQLPLAERTALAAILRNLLQSLETAAPA
jgi:hypothetical protein